MCVHTVSICMCSTCMCVHLCVYIHVCVDMCNLYMHTHYTWVCVTLYVHELFIYMLRVH